MSLLTTSNDDHYKRSRRSHALRRSLTTFYTRHGLEAPQTYCTYIDPENIHFSDLQSIGIRLIDRNAFNLKLKINFGFICSPTTIIQFEPRSRFIDHRPARTHVDRAQCILHTQRSSTHFAHDILVQVNIFKA